MFCDLGLRDLVNIEPATAHADCTIPLLEHLLTLFGCDLWFEDHAVLLVDGLELAKLFPDVDSKAGGDGGTQGGSFAHGRTVDGDTDDVRLCLC